MFLKSLLLGVAVSLSFLLGYTTVAKAWPGVANRAEHHGYFRNIYDTSGSDVWANGIPATVATGDANSANSFIGFVNAKLNDTSADRYRNRVGAVFLVKTMLGIPGGTAVGVTSAEWADWRARVLYAASQGRVNWNVIHPYTVNSYYQGNPPLDDAFFYDSGASAAIVFRNAVGTPIYAIRRICANPVGNLSALPPPPPAANFDLDPAINIAVNGGPSTDNIVEVGDQVRFTYVVDNNGTTASTLVSCTAYANTHVGYFPTPSPPTASGAPPPGVVTGCPRTFPVGVVTLAVENITITAGNQTICRSLFVNPAEDTGGVRGTEVCVVVANKPYTKVFGGDVAVGGGLETAPNVCTNNANGAIVSWNKGVGAGNFAGAGTQYAALALDTIIDFATSQNSVSAPRPSGLAFSNQGIDATDHGNGLFGGLFGSLPCIPDYYADLDKASSVTTLLTPTINVSSLVTGTYRSSLPAVTITGGNANPGQRISLFVDGDVYISANITYPGNWTTDVIPLFQLVVRGNIYVSRNVTQLDGVYIAQKTPTNTKGIFYSCTDPASPFTPLGLTSTLFNLCNLKLTVNGSVVANSVRLLRSSGTLGQSTPTEARATSTAGEVFNYNPSIWIAQPNFSSTGNNDSYDSITSLPPVL